MSIPTVQPETSPSFEGVQLLDTPVKVSAPPEDEEVGETIEDVFEQEPEPDSEPKPEQEPGEEEDIAGDIESEPEGEESGEVEDDGGSKVEDEAEGGEKAEGTEFELQDPREIKKVRDLRVYTGRTVEEIKRQRDVIAAQTLEAQELRAKAERSTELEAEKERLRERAEIADPKTSDAYRTEVEEPWKRDVDGIEMQLRDFELSEGIAGKKEDAFLEVAGIANRSARRERISEVFGGEDASDVMSLTNSYRMAVQRKMEAEKRVIDNFSTIRERETELAEAESERGMEPVRKELSAALGKYHEAEALKPFREMAGNLAKLAFSNGSTPLTRRRTAQKQLQAYVEAIPAMSSRMKDQAARIEQLEAALRRAGAGTGAGKRAPSGIDVPSKKMSPEEQTLAAIRAQDLEMEKLGE